MAEAWAAVFEVNGLVLRSVDNSDGMGLWCVSAKDRKVPRLRQG